MPYEPAIVTIFRNKYTTDTSTKEEMCESVKEWIHYELCKCVAHVHVMRVVSCVNAQMLCPNSGVMLKECGIVKRDRR